VQKKHFCAVITEADVFRCDAASIYGIKCLFVGLLSQFSRCAESKTDLLVIQLLGHVPPKLVGWV